ncbi:type II TA system antitoxin MqsA family protein [Massilia yuzhufengensis]|uniref:HTH-type transcriptional regulator / antitoxin MqsA n=1 Tax=Massilia yuzhufengensis TaxID=1164594 RepID=A0A1I1E9T4_9BURK|nr:type II TA system antitoxin MqsA family protein [Massilia yuzhufengensis]SFB83899.1 HTH-type transcriptional regulator / antitoxin MqsA [Massilia yuzhufengensis]
MLKCPNCGVSPLAHATRELVYSYKGKSTSIPDVVAEYCAGCSEVMFTQGEHEHYGEIIRAFRKQVDEAAPADIRDLRKRLGLTQRKADAMFGEESGEFAGYESGKEQAPVALVKLLKLLGSHPELLDEVR